MSIQFKSRKVKVKGRIQVGSELCLIRSLPSKTKPPKVIIRSRPPARIHPAQARAPRNYSGTGIDQEKMQYSLGEAPSQIYIKDQGLCQSYGIFGVPGCGKTFLMMHLLDQILAFEQSSKTKKFGGLLLDPKSALVGDIVNKFSKVGRRKDLIIINESFMKEHGEKRNLIHSFLDPDALGKALAMAAKSAGIGSREPFWLNELGKLFGAGLSLLELLQEELKTRPTLQNLASLFLGYSPSPGNESKEEENLQLALDLARSLSSTFNEDALEQFRLCNSTLNRFLENEKDKPILKSFMDQCYGLFRSRKFDVFSDEIPPSRRQLSLYDEIIENGKFVLVSVSKRNLAIAKILCTVIKVMFQQHVLTRFERSDLQNKERPLLFLADEYSDVATELKGESIGDSNFFSLMRQFGCMGLVATQSIHMLKNSGLEDAWQGIVSNMAAKIFMQVGDPETADLASKLVGESEILFKTFDATYSKDGVSQNVKSEIKDKKDLPTRVVLQTLSRGQAVVVGSLSALVERPQTWFVHVRGKNYKGPNLALNRNTSLRKGVKSSTET